MSQKDAAISRARSSKWYADFIQRTGDPPAWNQLADIEEIRKRRAALDREHPDLSRSEKDLKDRKLTAPRGPLARVLDDLGIRPISSVRPGES